MRLLISYVTVKVCKLHTRCFTTWHTQTRNDCGRENHSKRHQLEEKTIVQSNTDHRFQTVNHINTLDYRKKSKVFDKW